MALGAGGRGHAAVVELGAVPGVAQVSAIGGELPEYQINVKQDRLTLHELTIQDVIEAARAAHSTASEYS